MILRPTRATPAASIRTTSSFPSSWLDARRTMTSRALLLAAGFVDVDVLRARAEILPGVPAVRRRVLEWLKGAAGPHAG